MFIAFVVVMLLCNVFGWAWGENRDLAYINAFGVGMSLTILYYKLLDRIK